MSLSGVTSYYFQLATGRTVLIRSLWISLIVGVILNLINHPGFFGLADPEDINPVQVILTFLVPFCVSSITAILTASTLKPGNISHLDALLKCSNCNKTNFHAHIGESIKECPTCGVMTRWKLSKIFSNTGSGNEILKSLALFARYNPQPLFRITPDSVILSANPASETLVGIENLTGEKLNNILPEINSVNLPEIIENEDVKELMIMHSGRYFNFVLKGVAALNSVHVYGNDISEIVLAEQKIKEQAKNINDSIVYASRIQVAMLPEENRLMRILPGCFIFYRPKNVVSGDFYWVNQIGNLKIVAVADCTGHGVPGAFMSMLGISLLNEIILRQQIIQPDKILNTLRDRIISSLSSEAGISEISDGMDISILVLNTEEGTLQFAGAYNPMLICRNSNLTILEADKMPVGKHFSELKSFSLKKEKVLRGDRYFLFSDGFKDQFGGEKNKKYSSVKFREMIIETDLLPFDQIYSKLEDSFDSWKMNNEQIDDVLVMGISI